MRRSARASVCKQLLENSERIGREPFPRRTCYIGNRYMNTSKTETLGGVQIRYAGYVEPQIQIKRTVIYFCAAVILCLLPSSTMWILAFTTAFLCVGLNAGKHIYNDRWMGNFITHFTFDRSKSAPHLEYIPAGQQQPDQQPAALQLLLLLLLQLLLQLHARPV